MSRPCWFTFPRWFRNFDWCTIPPVIFSLFVLGFLLNPPLQKGLICSYISLQAYASVFSADANQVPQTRLLHLTFRVHESNSTVWPTHSLPFYGHISDEITQTASQPYDCSILNSFQIKSRVIIYWWLEKEKPFVSEQIYFSLKLRPSDFNFTSYAAAEVKLLKAQMMCSNVLFRLNKTS